MILKIFFSPQVSLDTCLIQSRILCYGKPPVSKARRLGAGFRLFYRGVDGKRNGVGAIMKEEFVWSVLVVKRVSDRAMSLKIEIEGVMFSVVNGPTGRM